MWFLWGIIRLAGEKSKGLYCVSLDGDRMSVYLSAAIVTCEEQSGNVRQVVLVPRHDEVLGLLKRKYLLVRRSLTTKKKIPGCSPMLKIRSGELLAFGHAL
jgi:hypothetical protein